ncbi:hypothetical protein CCACVL1_10429 [Corchorus capsularis]|uniref:non-specific serine/threonine protein kinase n=1 Tax=Corchorus capsularis TaxID=210143 RepID=A0A1R3IR90_COCAP|nr:hypothetical protein CCACVL1_10429 [Corchorus capsularis]
MSCRCFGLFDWFNKRHNLDQEKQAQEFATDNIRLFSYNSLRSATSDFHPSNRIGGGGFGVVYRGVLRDGTQVAIKRLSTESKQGSREFVTEINMISNIRHPNLVELIGCCAEDNHRILVYEYMENNSLASVLLGSKSKYIALDWPRRVAICLGAASGLAFLHYEAEPHIVHRDIKASNILLDKDFHPKIGDFGLAKLFPDNVTHISTRVAGTVKKTRIRFQTWKLKEEERLLEIVDPEMTTYPEDEVLRFIKVALFCTQAAAHQRPNMKQVVDMLSKDVHLNEKILTEPGVYRGHSSKHLGIGSSSSSSLKTKGKPSVDPSSSTNIMSSHSITQMLPR